MEGLNKNLDFALWKVRCHLVWVCSLFTNALVWMKNKKKKKKRDVAHSPKETENPSDDGCLSQAGQQDVIYRQPWTFLQVAPCIYMYLAMPKLFWWHHLPEKRISVPFDVSCHSNLFFHCTIKLSEDTWEQPPKRMTSLSPYFDLAQSFLVTRVYKTIPRKWQKNPAVHMGCMCIWEYQLQWTTGQHKFKLHKGFK